MSTPTFLAPTGPALDIADELMDSQLWNLIEDVLPDAVTAWRAVEERDNRKAYRILEGLVSTLRTRRDILEADMSSALQ
ncbi:hypothetical protein P3H15_52170 [Rhodococcus sp. T2V]|uniref:hypothetical protein n=1 Tax=Rhodococcus sp. T2V TaxID=3034164 RepID=UPI0023E2CBC1|nr:hypothetical protein [Rhodococcus sp. T2V]MDF3313463.1 hypothetical protein [Rhodococcus sp. T2V]